MPRKKRYRKQSSLVRFLSDFAPQSQKESLRLAVRDLQVDRPEDLSPADLEELAAQVYMRSDYKNVKHTGGSNDGGVDVWMLNKTGDVEIVQCKQLQNRVTRPDLIAFGKTMKQQHAGMGHYWAPSGFTQPAIDYAKEKNIQLYESLHIRLLVKKAYKSDIAQIKTVGKYQRRENELTGSQKTVLYILGFVAISVVCCSIVFFMGATA
jgi:restriction endonuclease Mrr